MLLNILMIVSEAMMLMVTSLAMLLLLATMFLLPSLKWEALWMLSWLTWVHQPDSLKEGPHMSSSWWRVALLEYYCPLLGWWEGRLRFSSWLFPLRFHCLCLCSPAPSPLRLEDEEEMVKIKPIIVRTYFLNESHYYKTKGQMALPKGVNFRKSS